MKRDNAFTGLEAAIVLIAFVVVAAIFSYVMLGAGFFASQKAQEVTYASIKQTTSNLIPDGTIYGNMAGTGAAAQLEMVQLALSVPVGGQSLEFKDILLTYSQEGKIPANYNLTVDSTGKSAWATVPTSVGSGEFRIATCTGSHAPDTTLISPGNSCNVVLNIGAGGPTSGNWFQVEIKPPIGAPTTIRKTIPTGYKGGKLL
jgi:flagellin FlaB